MSSSQLTTRDSLRSPSATAAETLERVSVIIPALNEEESLPHVLRALPKVRRVLVVDNGSTDSTADKAAAAGAKVIHQPVRGYGSACLAGIAALNELDIAPDDIVVFLDADYSDDPTCLRNLVEPIAAQEARFVLGSRMLGEREPGAMPFQSRWGNRLACFLMWLFWGCRYTDLGPFRAITYEKLLALDMRDKDFGWTVEMQIKAHQHGLATLEIPVPYRCRIGQSKISGTIRGTFAAGHKILLVIFRNAMRKPRPEETVDG